MGLRQALAVTRSCLGQKKQAESIRGGREQLTIYRTQRRIEDEATSSTPTTSRPYTRCNKRGSSGRVLVILLYTIIPVARQRCRSHSQASRRYGTERHNLHPGRPRTQALTARACWSPYCLSVRWNYDYIRGALTCAFSALLRLWQIHCSVTWAVVQNYTLEFDSIYIGNDNSDSVLGTSQVFNYKHYIWVTLANH